MSRRATSLPAILPSPATRQESKNVEALSRACRGLPIPVIGRVKDGTLYLDLRCLDEEDVFVNQLYHLFGSSAQDPQ